jgi:hypothetical protein
VYSFRLKEENKNFDIVLTKTILAVDATVAFLQMHVLGLVGLLIGVFFIVLTFYVREYSKRMPLIIIIIGGIFSLCLLTATPYFILILVLYWFLNKTINKHRTVEVSDKGVIIINPFSAKKYEWNQILFIVLKDGVLTIQFSNEHFFQSDVEWEINLFSDNEFNQFCDKITASGN